MTIVRANPNLLAGGLGTIRRSVTSQRDGSVVLQAEYVCLTKHAGRWTPFFVRNAPPPLGLPDSLSDLGATSTPKMYDVTTRNENGLTYFTALYSAASSREITVTETEEQRNWSGTVQYNLNGGYLVFTANYSFDYMSKSVTVTGRNTHPGEIEGSAGTPFNRSFIAEGASVLKMPTRSRIVSRTKTQSSLGDFSYSTTSTGIYEL
jgi:hypothetical protein